MQRVFQRVLQEDRQRRVQAAGSKIEGLMADERVKEAWDHLARCYHHTREKQEHPTREGLD